MKITRKQLKKMILQEMIDMSPEGTRFLPNASGQYRRHLPDENGHLEVVKINQVINGEKTEENPSGIEYVYRVLNHPTGGQSIYFRTTKANFHPAFRSISRGDPYYIEGAL